MSHDVADTPPRIHRTRVSSSCGKGCTFTTPKFISRSGDSATVYWQLATEHVNPSVRAHPLCTDWIGLYESDAPNDEYLEYFYPNATGHGQQTLSFYNLRVKMTLRYIRDCQCLCMSEPIGFALGASEPTQGHLSLTGDPAEMQVTWISGDVTGWAELESGDRISSTTSRYSGSDMCAAPATLMGPWAFRDTGWIHTATLKGLKGNTAYTYRYGNGDAAAGWATFWTEPDPSQEWKVIAYGDMGISGNPEASVYVAGQNRLWDGAVHSVRNDVLARNPSLVVHFGDISYARSVGFMWDLFGTQMEPLARTRPYMVSLGNHEYDHRKFSDNDPSSAGDGFHPEWGNYNSDDSHGECGVPVVKRWPNPPPTGFGIFWYSFDYANTHWVMLSSEHNFAVGAPQHDWLARDLKKVDRKRTPWVIVTAHRPAYNSEDYLGDWNVAVNMAANFDPLLTLYNVDLFLAGHYHSYLRTCPVANMICQPGRAPVHITVGSAGIDLDHVALKPEGDTWTVRSIQTWGTLQLRVRPDKIIGEFWGSADCNQPLASFDLLDSFEILPRSDEVYS